MKRFYKHAQAIPLDERFCIQLDGRTIKTPNKQTLKVPTNQMAECIAQEWNDVDMDYEVVPADMHIMCLASTAIDKVIPNMDDITQSVLSYADTDVLCYRCANFEHLRNKQEKTWNPWIDYAYKALRMDMQTTTGIMPITQSDTVQKSATESLAKMTPYQITAFAEMVAILGSFVMSLALIRDDTDVNTAFDVCYLDEQHQISEWGEDDESTQSHTAKKTALQQAYYFYKMC